MTAPTWFVSRNISETASSQLLDAIIGHSPSRPGSCSKSTSCKTTSNKRHSSPKRNRPKAGRPRAAELHSGFDKHAFNNIAQRRKHFPHIAQSRCRLHIFSNAAFVFFDRNGRRPISLAVTDDVKGFAFAMRAVAAGAKFFMTWEEQK